MGVSRRMLLRMGGAAMAVSASSARALAAPALIGLKELNARTLSFDCYYTGEKLKKVTYWADGKYEPTALTEINRTLRDYWSGEVHPIDPGVLDVLHRIGRALETDGRFEILCGYRSSKTNAALRRKDSQVAARSLHMDGKAVDFWLPDRRLSLVHKTALAQQRSKVLSAKGRC